MFANGSGALWVNKRRERLKETVCQGSCASHPAGLLVLMDLYWGHRFKHPAESTDTPAFLFFLSLVEHSMTEMFISKAFQLFFYIVCMYVHYITFRVTKIVIYIGGLSKTV